MSSTCGNCDCADKSQCVKKGNGYDVVMTEVTEKSYFEEIAEVAENDPKCKCGPNCSCGDCSCHK